jgi:hypothetical protein
MSLRTKHKRGVTGGSLDRAAGTLGVVGARGSSEWAFPVNAAEGSPPASVERLTLEDEVQ